MALLLGIHIHLGRDEQVVSAPGKLLAVPGSLVTEHSAQLALRGQGRHAEEQEAQSHYFRGSKILEGQHTCDRI